MNVSAKLSAVLLALFCVLASSLALRAQSDVIYILPDPTFVGRECDHLTHMQASGGIEMGDAIRAVAEACQTYASDHNGDRWFAAIRKSRAYLDTYERSHTQHAALIAKPAAAIPAGANAYALFLVTNDSWEAGANIGDLRAAFATFGDAIGDENLAIWFEQPGNTGNVDRDRSRAYFSLFNLGEHGYSLDGGPYVVTTSVRPDLWSTANDATVIRLSSMSVSQISTALNILAKEISRKSGQARPSYPAIIADIRDAKRENVVALSPVDVASFPANPRAH